MGRPGGTGREHHGIRPDLSASRYRFAQSPRGPSQLQLWDVKTIGVYESYSRNYHVPPADQRARRVPKTVTAHIQSSLGHTIRKGLAFMVEELRIRYAKQGDESAREFPGR